MVTSVKNSQQWYAFIIGVVIGLLLMGAGAAIAVHVTTPDCPEEDSCEIQYEPDGDGTGGWYIDGWRVTKQ